MYRGGFYRGGPILMSAISGIDQALWDIKGKYHNAPIHMLMGGKARDSMRVYSWIGGDRPVDVGVAATEVVRQRLYRLEDECYGRVAVRRFFLKD